MPQKSTAETPLSESDLLRLASETTLDLAGRYYQDGLDTNIRCGTLEGHRVAALEMMQGHTTETAVHVFRDNVLIVFAIESGSTIPPTHPVKSRTLKSKSTRRRPMSMSARPTAALSGR